jgi:hypothetical protein
MVAKKSWIFVLMFGLVALLVVPVSAHTPRNDLASSPAAAPQQPQSGVRTAAQPQSLNPLTLPLSSEAAPQAASETHAFYPEDRQAFAKAKAEARGKAIGQTKDNTADTADAASAGGPGPAEAPLEATGESGPLDPTGSTNFLGLDENGLIPPDTNIAAGPSNLVEVVNDEIAVYSKAGAVLVGPSTLQSWFGRAATDRIFDPVVTYRGGRFYVVTLFRNTTTQVSEILLSASTSNNATGGWCNYSFNGEQATTNWADYPRVGITADRILIATNQFNWTTNAHENNFLNNLPKASVDACAGFNFETWWDFFDSDGSRGFTLNPALDYDAFSSTAFYMVNAQHTGVNGGGSVMTVWRRVPASNTWTRFNIGVQAYNVPPGARQPGTATRVATNDPRILYAVKRYNKIWAFQTTSANPGCSANISAVHFIAINAPASTTTAPTANHDWIYHGGCDFDYYFPTGTVDGNGNMLAVFNRSSAAERPNLRFTGWHAANFPNQTAFPAGGGGYFASTRIGAAPGAFTETRGRWGDYSGVSLDPASPQQYVWIAGEVLAGNNFWTTRIGRITHAPVPSAP